MNPFAHRSITLAPGETSQVINHMGNAFKVMAKNVDPYTSGLKVRFDAGDFEELMIGLGMNLGQVSEDGSTTKPFVFKAVTFRNDGAASISFRVIVFIGLSISDPNVEIAGSVETMEAAGSSIASPAALTVQTSAATKLDADSTIKERIIQNSGDTYNLWVGDENVDPANNRGIIIYAGGQMVLSCSDDVYLKAQDGATTVSVLNVFK